MPQHPGANWSALFVLCGLLAATLGCSAKVKVESETWDRTPEVSTGERNRTAVEVDVLRNQPTPNPPESKPNTTVLHLGSGDIHVHEPPPHPEPG